MAWTLETLRQRCEEILASARRYGAMNLRVFRLIVRGDADESEEGVVIDFRAALEEVRRLGLPETLARRPPGRVGRARSLAVSPFCSIKPSTSPAGTDFQGFEP